MKDFFSDLWASKAFKSFVFSAAGALAALISAATADVGGSMGGVIAAVGAFAAAALNRWLDEQPKEQSKQ